MGGYVGERTEVEKVARRESKAGGGEAGVNVVHSHTAYTAIPGRHGTDPNGSQGSRPAKGTEGLRRQVTRSSI